MLLATSIMLALIQYFVIVPIPLSSIAPIKSSIEGNLGPDAALSCHVFSKALDLVGSALLSMSPCHWAPRILICEVGWC